MNPKTFLTKTTSVIATLLLAVGGSLISTQPANAAFDPASALEYQNVTRGNPQISGTSVTDSIAIQSGERSYGYSVNLALTSSGNTFVLGTALTSSNKPTLVFTASSGGTSIPINSSYSNWWIEYSTGAGYATWDPASNQTLATGTYTAFTIMTSANFSSSQAGPKTIDVTYSVSLNGTTATPRGLGNNTSTGLTVGLPSNTVSYTPVTNDKSMNASFRACIWTADQSGLASGDTVQVSGLNTVTNSNTVSYIYPMLNVNGMPPTITTVSQTAKSFVFPAATSILDTSIQVYVSSLTVGEQVSLSVSAQKNGAGANLFDACFKSSSAPAVSPTITPNGTTTSISWTAPSDLNSAGYTHLWVLACASSLTNCATLSSLTSMMSRGYTFTNSTALSLSATTFTASASTMSAGMGSPVSWSASTEYKYAVVYTKSSMFMAGMMNNFPGFIWISSPSTLTAANSQVSNQQQNIVTATVERSIPTPVFQAPILNSLAPKMSAGFSSNGGRLVLKDVKPTDITSVTLNGKTVAVVPSKSGAALRIPAGAGAGDLKFTMADGTVIDVANAVKITQSQVDPKLVDLNNLPTFKAGSVAVPATIKAALTKNKEVILDSANAKCVGYASSNTAAAKATALSRASNVCGVITDMNENIEPIIKVLVNKVVAKKSPVKYQTW